MLFSEVARWQYNPETLTLLRNARGMGAFAGRSKIQNSKHLLCVAHAIRHEQQGEIALMQGVYGRHAVFLATQFADNVNSANE